VPAAEIPVFSPSRNVQSTWTLQSGRPTSCGSANGYRCRRPERLARSGPPARQRGRRFIHLIGRKDDLLDEGTMARRARHGPPSDMCIITDAPEDGDL